MTDKEKLEALARPFPANEVAWRIRSVGINGSRPWAMVSCYVTNRAVMDRLDEVFGAGNWRNEFMKWGEHSVLCGLSCRINGEWVTRWDGAAERGLEAVEGGFSCAMKRAAVQWGIGRYLYRVEKNFAVCSLSPRTGLGWRRAVTPERRTVWWRAPLLPAWALPPEER
ncbi:MAG: recombinase [Lentisphaeria bacterium]|nr:recombinase [Lentisphaeria bacterium]